MEIDVISALLILFAIIFILIVYLIILNILKFIVSIRFFAKLIDDFKKVGKKYKESEVYKKWNPWDYR